jgi:hypothetical protein
VCRDGEQARLRAADRRTAALRRSSQQALDLEALAQVQLYVVAERTLRSVVLSSF